MQMVYSVSYLLPSQGVTQGRLGSRIRISFGLKNGYFSVDSIYLLRTKRKLNNRPVIVPVWKYFHFAFHISLFGMEYCISERMIGKKKQKSQFYGKTRSMVQWNKIVLDMNALFELNWIVKVFICLNGRIIWWTWPSRVFQSSFVYMNTWFEKNIQ